MSRDFVLRDAAGKALVSNNSKGADFVLDYESPISRRRQLRASKELEDEERSTLEALVVCGAACADHENDEIGSPISPMSPSKKPSFKNGRRIMGTPTTTHQDDPAKGFKVSFTSEPPKIIPGPPPPSPVDKFFGDMLQNSSLLAAM